MPMPWRMAAGKIASPPSTLNARPLGCTVTLNGPAGASTLVIFGYPRALSEQRSILPSNQSPLGALPSRFRRERLLIVGCGDVGLRVARIVAPRLRVLALTSSPSRVGELRGRGITPLLGNLDDSESLRRLAGIATR